MSIILVNKKALTTTTLPTTTTTTLPTTSTTTKRISKITENTHATQDVTKSQNELTKPSEDTAVTKSKTGDNYHLLNF